jgi:hypothetical protein
VWANCKQPPRCLWCGGGHLHKDFLEKGNASSTPACCNCQLAEGEKAHPANYSGCKHAREEVRKRKPQTTPKPTAGRVFSSNSVKPHVVLGGSPWQGKTTNAGGCTGNQQL